MPRNGSGVYSLPGAYLATDGTTANASTHNTPLEDLQTDMNTARPVVAGGTGATTAAAARTSLDVPSNSEAVLVTGNQTVAGTKTFSSAVVGDLTGDVTGNLTGNVTGNVTGNITGDLLTLTTQGDLLYHDGTNGARLAKGTGLQQLRMNSGATAPEWFTAESGLTVGSSVATTSGTSATLLSSVDSSAQRITLVFSGFSTDSTSNFLVQLGDSGGFETSGYTSSATNVTGNTGATATNGFVLTSTPSAAEAYYGRVVLQHVGSNQWVMDSNIGSGGTGHVAAGTKTLSGALTQVRITTVSGDTFDGGAIIPTTE